MATWERKKAPGNKSLLVQHLVEKDKDKMWFGTGYYCPIFSHRHYVAIYWLIDDWLIGILPCFLKEEHVRWVPQAILEGMIKEALSASNILLWKKGYEEYRREWVWSSVRELACILAPLALQHWWLLWHVYWAWGEAGNLLPIRHCSPSKLRACTIL